MATEILNQRTDLSVERREQPCERAALMWADRVEDGLDDHLLARPEEHLVHLIGHAVDRAPEQVAVLVLERPLQPAAVLDLEDAPADRLELMLELARLDHRHDSVEALAVQVDDPEYVPQASRRRLDRRLPHCPLVELGVAEQRDEASPGAHLEVFLHITVCERAEERRGGAEADRPRGEVDVEGVLRSARICLQTAEVAQRRQVLGRQPPEEVLDRVQHGRCVRLDADAVACLEVGEVEGGHQRHHRRRRRLVTADLELVLLRSLAIRVVDDSHREPEHAALDRLQYAERVFVGNSSGSAHAGRVTALMPAA